MGKCPKCGSTDINQYRMLDGPMWCSSCGFMVEDKTLFPNPFVQENPADKEKSNENSISSRPSMAEALYEYSHAKKQINKDEQSETV
ncbi:MAG: hypothetical protein JEZ00_15710 [Anaerolineaceae bacterium]|nr:hypothetical protein [Anaerolineaceae bacterium]